MTRATIEVHRLFSEVPLFLGAQDISLPKTDFGRKKTKLLHTEDEKSVWPRVHDENQAKTKLLITDDFGLRSCRHRDNFF